MQSGGERLKNEKETSALWLQGKDKQMRVPDATSPILAQAAHPPAPVPELVASAI